MTVTGSAETKMPPVTISIVVAAVVASVGTDDAGGGVEAGASVGEGAFGVIVTTTVAAEPDTLWTMVVVTTSVEPGKVLTAVDADNVDGGGVETTVVVASTVSTCVVGEEAGAELPPSTFTTAYVALLGRIRSSILRFG